MVRISPSILSANQIRLGEELRIAQNSGIDMFHIDVMDGHFVPNITFGIPLVEWLKKEFDTELDVHLMISNPDIYAEKFARAGADIVTVHVEATDHLDRTLNSIKEAGARPSVTLNPATPLVTVEHALEIAEMVLIMSVNPGFGGQSYIPYSTGRIKTLSEMIMNCGREIHIEVDGGIGPENVSEVVKAGADILVAGSAVFSRNHRDIPGNIKALQEAI